MPIKVTVTNDEAIAISASSALQMLRRVTLKRNTDRGYVAFRPFHLRFADTYSGGLGEIALAKALGLAWTPGGIQISHGDVGSDEEARCTHYKSGKLIIYKNDEPGSRFWLVIGDFPDYEVFGWILGREGMKEEFWDATMKTPCFTVPQSFLNPINDRSEYLAIKGGSK